MSSLLERTIEKRPDKVRFSGRILFLTEDPELIKRQLAGEDLPWDTKNPANNPDSCLGLNGKQSSEQEREPYKQPRSSS